MTPYSYTIYILTKYAAREMTMRDIFDWHKEEFGTESPFKVFNIRDALYTLEKKGLVERFRDDLDGLIYWALKVPTREGFAREGKTMAFLEESSNTPRLASFHRNSRDAKLLLADEKGVPLNGVVCDSSYGFQFYDKVIAEIGNRAAV